MSGNPYPNIVSPAFVYDAQTRAATILGTVRADDVTLQALANGRIEVTHGGQLLTPVNPLGQTLPPELGPTVRDTANITALLFDDNDVVQLDNRGGGLNAVRILVFGHDGDDALLTNPERLEARSPNVSRTAYSGGGGRDRLGVILAETKRDDLVEIVGVPVSEIPDPEIRVIDKTTNALTSVVSFLEVEEAAVETGAGADEVFMDNTTGLLTNIRWNVSMQAGGDRFRYLGPQGSTSGGDIVVHLDTGGGGDDIGVDSPAIGGTQHWQIDAGSGANQTQIVLGDGNPGPWLPNGRRIDIDYLSGNGIDRLLVRYTALLEAAFGLRTFTGGGADTVDVTIAPVASPVQLNPSDPSLPDGTYRVDITTGAGADLVDLGMVFRPNARAVRADIVVDTGVGDDLFDFSLVSGVRLLDAFLSARMGTGADASRVQSFTSAGTLTGLGNGSTGYDVDLGAENDRLGVLHQSTARAAALGLQVDSGSGDDTLDLEVQSNGLPPTPNDPRSDFVLRSTVVTGSGDDVLNYRHTHRAAWLDAEDIIDMGGGDDRCHRLWRLFELIPTNDQPLGTSSFGRIPGKIDLGPGSDILGWGMQSTLVGLDFGLTVTGGIGDDRVLCTADFPNHASTIKVDLGIDLGTGDDELDVLMTGRAKMDFTARFSGGAGDDQITAEFALSGQPGGSLAVTVEGNEGDDDLELALFGVVGLDDVFAVMDGGPGLDTARATFNVLVKNVERFTPVGP